MTFVSSRMPSQKEEKKEKSRYFPNPFLNEPHTVQPLSAEAVWGRVDAQLPDLLTCFEHGAVPTSTGKFKGDGSVYTGLGGVAVAFLRCGLCSF